MKNSRRDFLKQSASLAALSAVGIGTTACTPNEKNQIEGEVEWPVMEGANTPKICLWTSRNADEKALRRWKQIGVDHAVMGGPSIPWQEDELREIMERFEAGGLSIMNMMIGGYRNVIYGREGRDAEIENVQKSLQAAGAVGLPVVEHNWYTDRLREGYYEVEGRGGAGYTGYDYELVKELPPDPDVGAHTAEELWDRLTYFLEAVIPVAEEAGVRMALHPNDPPAPESHGSAQILITFDDWKRVIGIVDSPSNGMTCHSGVTTEIGVDPLEVIRYLGRRDRINHVHFRNVVVEEPIHKYVEVFPDNGQTDMFAFMREIIRQGFTLGIHTEHPRALDYDREHPDGITGGYANVGGGGYTGLAYNVAYGRAMMQAALIVEGKV